MSDPLLTTLCSICHSEPPKYKCPRCGSRSCSLPCVRKHKAWASCNGERDPAAFVPRPRLCTESGVDHDYNFISKIERARERFEKEVTEGRNGLFSEKELRGPRSGEDRRFEKVWRGDQLHHMPVTAGSNRGGYTNRRGQGRPGDEGRILSGLDKQVRRRLRTFDIEVVAMPKGLSRQRQNKTAWNRRTNTINWQVEWVVVSTSIPAASHQGGGAVQIIHKALDEQPLCKAFGATLDWHLAGVKRAREAESGGFPDGDELPPNKRRRTGRKKQHPARGSDTVSTGAQDPEMATWGAGEYVLQSSLTGRWDQILTLGSVPETKEEQEAGLTKLQFFLLKPGPSSDGSKHLIPLSSVDSLSSALSGRTVVEFPTIYVFDPDTTLPPSFTLESTERRPPRPQMEPEEGGDDGPSAGRQRGRLSAGRRGGHARQPARPDTILPETGAGAPEEGEINSDNEPLDAGAGDADRWDGISAGDTGSSEDEGPSDLKAQQVLVDYDSSSD